MTILFQFCVTAAIKEAARRCYNITNRKEVRLLKVLSSAKLDMDNATNLKDPVCDTMTTTSAPASVAGSESNKVVVDTDTVEKDNPVATGPPSVDIAQHTVEKKPSTLSKRAARRQRRKHAWHTGKSSGETATKNLNVPEDSAVELNETSYYFENGLRKVYPYYFTFNTHVKGRWIARTVRDVFTAEFLHGDVARLEEVVGSGRVKVNGKQVRLDYKFKDNDFLESAVHRHEVPVIDTPMEILENTEEMVVINKPCSIPVHPCGRYRHNSVTFILAKENGLCNLRTIYRLDRLTSGLLFFAKTEAKTKTLMDNIRNRELSKEYVCRVDGEFPEEIIDCREPLDVLTHKLGLWKVDPNGKESHSTFERLSFNGTSSVLRCKLHTGRTHQIRVHLQYLGYPIVNDPLYNNCPVWGPEKGKGGKFGKTEEQLVRDLLQFHDPLKFIQRTKSSNDPLNGTAVADHLAESTDIQQPRKKVKLCDSTEKAAETTAGIEHAPVDSTNVTGCDHAETADVVRTDPCKNVKHMYDPTKMTFDANCLECQGDYRDPTIEELTMYLHALHYKGPGWEYSTPLPDWAKEDWKQ